MPPFQLTPTQRAQLDAVRSDDAKTALLQRFHQVHAYAHRDRSIFGLVADPAAFSRWWNERAYEFISAAWEAYLAPSHAMAELQRLGQEFDLDDEMREAAE